MLLNKKETDKMFFQNMSVEEMVKYWRRYVSKIKSDLKKR